MTKKFLSMILAIAMVISMFAGLATTASAAGYAKATSIAVGDQVVLVCENALMEMTGISTTKTKYGIGTAYSGAPAGTMVFEVVAGASEGTFAFKNGENYLYWTSGNSLNVNATLSANTSWTVAFDVSGNAAITNAADTTRQIWWNNGSPRFACYANKTADATYYAVQLYKYSDAACTHANATSSVTTEPTCRTPGEKTFTCPDCNKTWTETIPATGHFWGEAVQTTAPTCTEDGKNTYTCSVCSGTKTEVIPATGHTYVGGTCSVCGAAEPVYYDYAKTELSAITAEHKVIITMTDGTTVWALSSANGTSAAPAAVVVTPSGDKINSNDSSLVWNITNTNGVLTIAPDGVTNSTLFCTDTNNGVRVGTSTSNTFGNAFSIDGTSGYLKVTTGTVERYVGVYTTNPDWRCYKNQTDGSINSTIAGQTLAFYAYKPAATEPTECTHANVTEVPAVSATCTAAGNSAYWSCQDCGKYFSDAACTTETTLEAVTIPATGHTPGAYTSNNNGTHTYTCSVCNEVVTESCSASVVEEVAATCNAYSQTEYECTLCIGTWTVTGTEYGAHNWVNNVCSVCSLTRNSYVKVADVTTLKDGDGIVIYYPTGAMLLSGTASGSKLAGVAGTVTDTTVAANNADELFLIVRVDANGDYYFETNDGKYLTSGETGNSLTLADSLTDYAKWYFDTTGTTATLRIVSRNAFYNGTTAQALEYYNGFTTYSLKDKAAYNFEVYQLEGFSAHTHTWDQGTVTTEATCTADGVKTFTCATCGDTMTEAIPATGHNYSAGDTCANCGLACIKGQLTAALADGDTVVVYNPAAGMTLTNTATGYHLAGLAAVDCGSYVLRAAPETVVWTVEVVDAAAGTYRFKTPDGVYFQSNSYGSFTNSATLPAAGEVDYSVWQLIDGKYLKNTGVSRALEYYGGKWQTYSSTRFGTAFELKFFKTNVESFCEHAYVETVISAPSCTTDGVSTFTCSLCGDTYTDTVVAPGHSYQVTAEVPATCTEAGSKTYTCSVCGDTYTEVVAATGHSDMNLDNLCDVCGVEVVNDAWALSTTAPAAGNKYVIVAHDTTANKWYALTTADINAATSAGKEVLVSNNVLYNPDEDVIFGGRDSSYTSNAVVHTGVGFYESNAGKCLHLNNSKIRVTTGSQNGVFTFTAGTTENTFTMLSTVNTRYLTFANGSFGVSDVSGTELYYFYKACDHDKTYISGAAEPTCTVAGSTGATKCSWCGTELVAAAEIPATGHSLELVAAVAATCTTDGNDAYYKCSVCGALFADAEGTTALNAIPTVPATGHTEVTDDAVAPTCTTTGLTAGSHCSVCNAVIVAQEEVPATGHTEVTDEAVAPTCTTTGLTAGSHCSVCGEVIVAQTEVAALGHTYTYTNNGDGTHSVGCANCDYSAVEDHSFTNGTCVCSAVEGPIAAADLVFFNKSLALTSYTAFNVICKYSVLEKYDSYYVVFERYDSSTGTVDRVQTAGATSTASAKYHSFEYPVMSYMMTDEITATLYAVKDGVTYVGETYTNSVRAYALSKIGTATEKMKSVYANLLNYGARAQEHLSYKTDDLATVGLDSYESYIVTSVPTTNNTSSITSDGYTELQLMTRALGLNAAVELQYVLKKTTAYAKEDLYAVYSFTRNGETIEGRIDGADFGLVSGYITIKVSALYATEGNTPVSLTVYSKADDSRLSETWTYSIESHVNLKVTGEPTTTQQKVLVALMNYYNAVSAAY